jgi:3-oxoacyl-[acyl-carrier protein] reductase
VTRPVAGAAPLAGRVAVLTGASRGVGRATAVRLASDGATVVGIARGPEGLASLPPEAAGLAGSIETVVLDVRSGDDVDREIRALEERLGRIDILVNNAGVERVKPFDAVADEDYEAMVETNLRGAFHCIRAALPGMKRRRSGHLVSVSSAAGIRGFGEDAVYSATKFGIVGLMDALDEELRPFGIRVTTICPGAIDTSLVTWAKPGYREHFLRPEDVAEAIAYAVSQPPHVAVGLLVVRPFVEPPHSDLLSLDTLAELPER